MKNKTVWLLISGLVIFVVMFLFLEFNYVEGIDVYGKSIQEFFSANSFETIFLFITNIMSFIGIGTILVLSIYFLRKKNAKDEILLYIGTIFSCLVITNLIKF